MCQGLLSAVLLSSLPIKSPSDSPCLDFEAGKDFSDCLICRATTAWLSQSREQPMPHFGCPTPPGQLHQEPCNRGAFCPLPRTDEPLGSSRGSSGAGEGALGVLVKELPSPGWAHGASGDPAGRSAHRGHVDIVIIREGVQHLVHRGLHQLEGEAAHAAAPGRREGSWGLGSAGLRGARGSPQPRCPPAVLTRPR